MHLFPDRLRALRHQRGWSLRQLATVAQVPFQTISRLERGTTRSPSLTTLGALADALEVTVDTLMGRAVRW